MKKKGLTGKFILIIFFILISVITIIIIFYFINLMVKKISVPVLFSPESTPVKENNLFILFIFKMQFVFFTLGILLLSAYLIHYFYKKTAKKK